MRPHTLSSLNKGTGALRLATAAAEIAVQRRQLQQRLLLRRRLHGAGNGGRRKRPASLLSGVPQPQQQEQRPPILSVGGRRGQSTGAPAAGGGGEKEKRPGSRDADFHKTGEGLLDRLTVAMRGLWCMQRCGTKYMNSYHDLIYREARPGGACDFGAARGEHGQRRRGGE